MGQIYAGETKLVHNKVAVKILHPELVDHPDMLLRFKMEAEIASTLNHPNIVNVFGSGVTPDGKPYIAMDYVEGSSLEHLLEEQGKVGVTECIDYFAQLARAVEFTHEKAVIHRDLKPSNVMLQPDGQGGFIVKLLDFGIAKSTSAESTVARELTIPGTVFGSVYYMSPEQVLGKKVDFRSDIYSFGCLLYHALAGHPPFEADAPVDCMRMHLDEAIPNVANDLPNEPRAEMLAGIVSTCMRKDPAQRFENSGQLRAALEKLNDFDLAAAQAAQSAELKDPEKSKARPKLDKTDVYAALSMFIIALVLSAVPFLYNLDLSKAEKKLPDETDAEHKKAQDSSKEAIAQTSQNVDNFLEQAQAALEKKDYGDAEKLARTAYLSSLSLGPDDPKIAEALFFLGQVFEARKNYDGALQAYNWTLSFREAKFGEMAPQTTIVRQRISEIRSVMGTAAQATAAPPRIKSK